VAKYLQEMIHAVFTIRTNGTQDTLERWSSINRDYRWQQPIIRLNINYEDIVLYIRKVRQNGMIIIPSDQVIKANQNSIIQSQTYQQQQDAENPYWYTITAGTIIYQYSINWPTQYPHRYVLIKYQYIVFTQYCNWLQVSEMKLELQMCKICPQ